METVPSLKERLSKDLAKQKALATINKEVCEVFNNQHAPQIHQQIVAALPDQLKFLVQVPDELVFQDNCYVHGFLTANGLPIVVIINSKQRIALHEIRTLARSIAAIAKNADPNSDVIKLRNPIMDIIKKRSMTVDVTCVCPDKSGTLHKISDRLKKTTHSSDGSAGCGAEKTPDTFSLPCEMTDGRKSAVTVRLLMQKDIETQKTNFRDYLIDSPLRYYALLEKAINETKDVKKQQATQKVIDAVSMIYRRAKTLEQKTIDQIDEALRETLNLLHEPTEVRCQRYLSLASEIADARSLVKILSGAMLALAGLCLLGLSAAGLILSHGATIPLSVYGINAGWQLLAGGAGLGTLLAGAGSVLAYSGRRHGLSQAMLDFKQITKPISQNVSTTAAEPAPTEPLLKA